MISTPGLSQSFIEQIQTGIQFPRQLYTLAQTESLILEEENYDDLEVIVKQKVELVGLITQQVHSLTKILAGSHELLREMSAVQCQSLESYKLEGRKLLELVSKVDTQNRVRLEKLRWQAVEGSHQIYQDRKLRTSYKSAPSGSPRFSQQLD